MKTKVSDNELLDQIEADTDEPKGPAIDAGPLRDIAAAVQRRTVAESDITVAVDGARDAGLSWAAIGAALGVSRQGALKRYGKR